MSYIDPHIHMVSRTTDDYRRMALSGCVFAWSDINECGRQVAH